MYVLGRLEFGEAETPRNKTHNAGWEPTMGGALGWCPPCVCTIPYACLVVVGSSYLPLVG